MTNETDTQKKRGRGRPRDPARGRAILEAARQVLDRQGYEGLTVDQVAQQAGVAKTTVYRRWASKPELVLEAVSDQAEPGELAETDDALEDLARLVERFYRRLGGTEQGRTLLAVASEFVGDPELGEQFRQRVLQPVRQRGVELVERAKQAGQLREAVDPAMLVDALVAPAFYGPVALGEPSPAGRARQIISLVLDGARAT